MKKMGRPIAATIGDVTTSIPGGLSLLSLILLSISLLSMIIFACSNFFNTRRRRGGDDGGAGGCACGGGGCGGGGCGGGDWRCLLLFYELIDAIFIDVWFL